MFDRRSFVYSSVQHLQVNNPFFEEREKDLSFLADTLAERDSLIENIFPKLKDYCREKYGLEFQVCRLAFVFEIELFSCSTFCSMRICDGEFKQNQPIIMEK